MTTQEIKEQTLIGKSNELEKDVKESSQTPKTQQVSIPSFPFATALVDAASTATPMTHTQMKNSYKSTPIHSTRRQSAPSVHHHSQGSHHHQHNVKFVNSTPEGVESQLARASSGEKKKRCRTTEDQLRILQRAFTTDPMPNAHGRLLLAKRLGMSARAVQVWFQNRRAKEKQGTRKLQLGEKMDEEKKGESQQTTSVPALSVPTFAECTAEGTSINALLEPPAPVENPLLAMTHQWKRPTAGRHPASPKTQDLPISQVPNNCRSKSIPCLTRPLHNDEFYHNVDPTGQFTDPTNAAVSLTDFHPQLGCYDPIDYMATWQYYTNTLALNNPNTYSEMDFLLPVYSNYTSTVEESTFRHATAINADGKKHKKRENGNISVSITPVDYNAPPISPYYDPILGTASPGPIIFTPDPSSAPPSGHCFSSFPISQGTITLESLGLSSLPMDALGEEDMDAALRAVLDAELADSSLLAMY